MGTIKFPHVFVPLFSLDGNSMVIVGTVGAALKRAGVPIEEREAFAKEALSADYDHVLQTVMAWVSTT